MSAIVAMSGGVDSSVALCLTKQKDEGAVIGVTMKLFSNEDIGRSKGKTCCSLDDVLDAKQVAEKLGVPHYTLDFSKDFRRNVIDKFVREYEAGRTPNPCVDCNRYIKYEALFRRLDAFGMDRLVTGHYAKIERDKVSNRFLLRKAADKKKDQTYFLYMLTQENLARSDFPLGEFTKNEIREIARTEGFNNASKSDSQDICFVPGGDYAAFIRIWTGKKYPAGDFVGGSGKAIGRHKNQIGYTIGQRKGLGLALGAPAYVTGKDAAKNVVYVGSAADLYRSEFTVSDVNLIALDKISEPMNVQVKTRYGGEPKTCRVAAAGADRLHVELAGKERAITPGQAAVFYDGDIVVGGGVIE